MPEPSSPAVTPAAETPKRAALAARLFEPMDIAPMVWFRIAFGLIMLWEVVRYWQYGWILKNYVDPNFHFTYYGFGWVQPWPGFGMEVHFFVMGVLAVAITVGLFYRLAATLFFFAFTYVFLLDQARYLNHFYLVCLYAFLLILVPAHRAFSVDAAMRPGLRSLTVPAWSLWALRLQMCVVYFMGGVAKLNPDWLRCEPMRMWLADRTSMPLIGRYFQEEWMVIFFSYGGLLFDLFIAAVVIAPRTRLIGFAFVIFFNVMNHLLFNIGIFPWVALGATVLLFAPSKWLPRPLPELWGLPPRAKAPAPSGTGGEAGTGEGAVMPAEADVHSETADVVPAPVVAPACIAGPLAGRQKVGVALFAAWLAFQLLYPLRHLVLYPGNPEWTEEGHRFAWRMKLRDKDGDLKFVAVDPATRRKWDINPIDYVTKRQFEEGVDRPDMILQLAHHIAQEWERKHGTRIEIYARAWASLNGRRMQRLIDPKVNLAVEPRNLKAAKWILPLTTPLVSLDAPVPDPGEDDEPEMKSVPVREPSSSGGRNLERSRIGDRLRK